MRLLNDTHRQLMHGARGSTKQPGEVRRRPNWIGGSRPGNAAYVPPPVPSLPELLGDLEKYLYKDDDLPKLLRIGLAHVQFESVHPYLDGNGRIGRLLIALLLEHSGLLKAPLFYFSLFFKRHRQEYFRRLTAVRVEGDWEAWTHFSPDGVVMIADETAASARELFAVVTTDRARVLAQDTTSISAARLFELLPYHPIITVAAATKLINTRKPPPTRAIDTLIVAGILVAKTAKKHVRCFAYQAYLDPLRIRTELERI